ncbi:MAG TPA: hypothetical protein VMY35_10195, partial [Phycisphaerae bacterium]|nr:hypothetical protein [Phycisphaerae bacterium]
MRFLTPETVAKAPAAPREPGILSRLHAEETGEMRLPFDRDAFLTRARALMPAETAQALWDALPTVGGDVAKAAVAVGVQEGVARQLAEAVKPTPPAAADHVAQARKMVEAAPGERVGWYIDDENKWRWTTPDDAAKGGMWGPAKSRRELAEQGGYDRVPPGLAAYEKKYPQGSAQAIDPDSFEARKPAAAEAAPAKEPWKQVWEMPYNEFDGPATGPSVSTEVTRALQLVPGSKYQEQGNYAGLTDEQARIIKEAEARGEAQRAVEHEAWEYAKERALASGDEKTKRLVEQGYRLNPHRVHYLAVQRAVAEGKPVPAEVLRDYAGEPWADAALAKQPAPAVGAEGEVGVKTHFVTREEMEAEWAETEKHRAANRLAEEERLKAEAVYDTQGFAEQLDAKGAALRKKTLKAKVKNQNRLISRRDLIQEKVDAGATVVLSSRGTRRLQTPDGAYLDESQIGKTAMDYAEYLATKPTAEAPTLPQVEKGGPGTQAGAESLAGGAAKPVAGEAEAPVSAPLAPTGAEQGVTGADIAAARKAVQKLPRAKRTAAGVRRAVEAVAKARKVDADVLYAAVFGEADALLGSEQGAIPVSQLLLAVQKTTAGF